jgi:cytoskeletal protein CcmA (bactofilin family)
MALWKEPTAPSPGPAPLTPRPVTETAPRTVTDRPAPEPTAAPSATMARPKERVEMRESLIASGLSIEGKISGTGHVRIAGSFKGDVQVDGNLGIEPGAKHQGEVRAAAVTVSGELTGNISAKHIDVTATGVIIGDVKADTITVAAGSRMRGHVEFGWADGTPGSGKIEHKGNGLVS